MIHDARAPREAPRRRARTTRDDDDGDRIASSSCNSIHTRT